MRELSVRLFSRQQPERRCHRLRQRQCSVYPVTHLPSRSPGHRITQYEPVPGWGGPVAVESHPNPACASLQVYAERNLECPHWGLCRPCNDRRRRRRRRRRCSLDQRFPGCPGRIGGCFRVGVQLHPVRRTDPRLGRRHCGTGWGRWPRWRRWGRRGNEQVRKLPRPRWPRWQCWYTRRLRRCSWWWRGAMRRNSARCAWGRLPTQPPPPHQSPGPWLRWIRDGLPGKQWYRGYRGHSRGLLGTWRWIPGCAICGSSDPRRGAWTWNRQHCQSDGVWWCGWSVRDSGWSRRPLWRRGWGRLRWQHLLCSCRWRRWRRWCCRRDCVVSDDLPLQE
jgi:hypothetical protein